MVAPLLGGARDVALDYTWSVSDGDGRFRNPTAAEREEFHEAVWSYRARNLDCASECSARGRFDGIWRCMTCYAIWTEPDDGNSYGIPLTEQEAVARLRQLRERSESDCIRYTVSARLDLRDAEEALRRYGERGREGDNSAPVVDVQLKSGNFIRFLVIRGYGGELTASWETAHGLNRASRNGAG